MTHTSHLSIIPKAPFHFQYTAHSHGWVALAPNTWDQELKALCRAERLSTGAVAYLRITGHGTITRPRIAITARLRNRSSPVERQEIRRKVRYMFRADEDLADLYSLCKKHGGRWARMAAGLGRLLRSPTVFEDVVKTICTTNIQWGGTKRMVQELVTAFGEPFPGDGTHRAFPTPESIAGIPFRRFQKTVSLGYRGPYVHTLAYRVASGDLDIEALREADIPTADLKKRLLAIKGVGPYAAGNLLMLLGRYDELAPDTVFREFVHRKYFPKRRPSDREAMSIYQNWKQWKYLAYWFDIWSDFQGEF
jgi:3-methyladenine DNA glycosylase/8-oxoguanine DNA glycosylase